MSTRLGPEDFLSGDPIRSWNKLYRTSEEPEYSQPDDPQEPDDSSGREGPAEPENEARHESMSWDSIANEAIERGYEVIEEQIRQGADVARQMRGYKEDVQQVNSDISRLVERSLGFSKDLSSLWIDYVQSFLRNPAIVNGDLYQAINPRPKETPDSGSSADAQDNAIEIALDDASVRIAIAEPIHDGLVVQPLQAVDGNSEAIRNVEFRQVDGRTVLNVPIPPDQPDATYLGVIFDKRCNLPKGTVTVVIDKKQA